VFIPTGKTVIAIVEVLAERELSLHVESEFLGVLQMENFWLFWKLNCTLTHPLKVPSKTRGVREYGQRVWTESMVREYGQRVWSESMDREYGQDVIVCHLQIVISLRILWEETPKH